jgi:hypothetical protein
LFHFVSFPFISSHLVWSGLVAFRSTLSEGPVLSVRYSLDGTVLAIQRTTTDIEFLNREKRTEFWQRCRPGESNHYSHIEPMFFYHNSPKK